MLHTIPALAQARITRPGYAIEYDFVPPTQISAPLETKRVEGLFHAGQINGTSGYEEAAAQGLMAGINAARKVQGKPPVLVRRDQGYVGVLIDDIVTKDICEPYRILTSRAEYRLLLRQDNADLRLASIGHELGLVSAERYRRVEEKRRQVAEELERLASTSIPPSDEVNAMLQDAGSAPLTTGVSALQMLRRPEITFELVAVLSPSPGELGPEAVEQVSIQAKYAGYLDRQRQEIERLRRLDEWQIPADWDYSEVVGLRSEAREKLELFRPATIGQAARIYGVNPADVSILLIHLRRTAG
jgi:tRNA uridine 5-carboxymethylaminomethyl modification enzyme